jgi:hypothetical protein
MFSEFQSNVASIQSITMIDHTGIDDNFNVTGAAITIPFAPDQANITITPTTSQNGVKYIYTAEMNIPRLQFAIKSIAETLYKRYVFIITDNNGSILQLGRRNKGYKINVSGSIGADSNNMTLGFTAESSQTFELL